MRTIRILAAALFILAISIPSAQAAKAAKLTEQEKADTLHVREQQKLHGDGELDLRDPANYRYVVRQFERAGYTRTRYPRLFASLDQLAKNGPVARPALAGMAAASSVEPVNVITEVKTSDQKSFAAEALSSIPGGTEATMLILGVYDEKGTPLGKVSQLNDFKGGTDVIIHANGAFSTPTPPEGRIVDTYGTYFYEDAAGVQHAGEMAAEFKFIPKEIQNYAPMPIKDPSIIVVCLNRTNQGAGTCDYDCSTGLNCNKQPPSDTAVRFPLKGYIEYFKNIDVGPDGKPLGATSRIVTTFPTTGGGCKLPFTAFYSDPNTKVENGNRLVWDINPATFGNACYTGQPMVTYAFMATLYTEGQPISSYINNTGGTPEENTFKLKPMKMYVGCLAPGSKVALADGSEQVIESFGGGERVKSGNGRVLTVAGNTIGHESKPLITIETKNGHILRLTDQHAVPTSNGIKLARELKKGDVVYTAGGASALAAVSSDAYSGQVYNIDLGVTAERAKLTNENRTFYANGILVGDAAMQGYWSLKHSGPARKPLAKAWATDFRSAKEDAAKKH